MKMEVVPIRVNRSNSPITTIGLPFNKRNVEEWSRLDRLTGIVETAKIETNHWAARTNNAAHNYGKVVDSRERNNSDGSLQERQRKQMEVYQTKVPGGSMQVIRTQTITTSSKKWTNTSEKGFEDLELPVNSLDLSSQKTKGSVGRSGSIGGRRPPTRPRSLISQSSNIDSFGEDSSAFKFSHNLYQRTRTNAFDDFSDLSNHNNSFNGANKNSDIESNGSGVVITDVTDYSQNEGLAKNGLTRQKSCSNDNLAGEAENEDVLRRFSKVRRSLQLQKQNNVNADIDSADDTDVISTKSLRERAAEIEKLLRRGSSTYVPPIPDKPTESLAKIKYLKTKDSFISAETLKEVRERLKKSNLSDNETRDDGIVSEKDDSSPSTKVKCFVYGIENDADKKFNINGTGSLESRYTNKNSTNGGRTSEWYKRRKSYGFEQVDECDKFDKINNKKNFTDSSTDSGICQSSETMGIPSWTKAADSFWSKISPDGTVTQSKAPLSTVVTVRVKKNSSEACNTPVTSQTSNLYDKAINSIYLDGPENVSSSQAEDLKREDGKRRMFKQSYKDDSSTCESAWNRKSPIPIPKSNETRETIKTTLRSAKNPWISQLRGTKLVDRNWGSDEQEDSEENRSHSDNSDRQIPVFSDKDVNRFEADSNGQKKNKKVEFCKTEVHFAAESGKFNIVETDGKPPPNDIFRRRRRTNVSTFLKNPHGLPETKFGDSTFEKNLLLTPDKTQSISEKIEAELNELSRIVVEALPQTNEVDNNNFRNQNSSHSWLYDVAEEPVESNQHDDTRPRSILKNFRNSIILGENYSNGPKRESSNEDSSVKPNPTSPPVWRSTVILRNKRFDDVKKRSDEDRKPYASDGETELQIRIRNLRKTDPDKNKPWQSSLYPANNADDESKRRSLPDDTALKNFNNFFGSPVQKMTISHDEMPSLSVAERVKQVEELKGNNYSTKINFRSGEMTVVQNGTSSLEKSPPEDKHKSMTSWANQKKISTADEKSRVSDERPLLSCDNLTTASNPPVMRLSTNDDNRDDKKYQTTRILINLKTSGKDESKQTENHLSEKINKNNSNKISGKSCNTYGSWSSGMKANVGRYLNDLKSASLVKETVTVPSSEHPEPSRREGVPRLSKPVHEIIDQFDSLSLPLRSGKEKRRKRIPNLYNATAKEYTHSDLEEELKNFTENLDKDFRDIYEEEIGSIRKAKTLRERNSVSSPKVDGLVRPVILNRPTKYHATKSSSDEGSKKSSQRTSSRDNYDTDDSDLLADEEVRSYMSAGHGGSDSETERPYGSSNSQKSIEDSKLRFKNLESQMIGKKEIKNIAESIQTSEAQIQSQSLAISKFKDRSMKPINPSKVTSVALKYEECSLFDKPKRQNNVETKSYFDNGSPNDLNTDAWDKASNSSSNLSSKPRERVSYLNGYSLSEKYAKYPQKITNSSSESVLDGKIRIIRREAKSRSDEYREYLMKSKSDGENCGYKCGTTSNRNILNIQPKNEPQVKAIKEDKVGTERSKQSKYSSKSEDSEWSRHRSKPNGEKQVTRKNQIDNDDLHGYHSDRCRRKKRTETDDAIMKELKKAADEILIAVNGYTDDSSLMGSSEEDKPKRIIRKDKIGNLGTISEGKRVIKTEMRKSVKSPRGRMTANQSSASSIESLTKEPIKTGRDLKISSRCRHGESGRAFSSRSSRLLQRANTREAVILQPSSSEDIPSYLEQAKKRVLRRQKSSSSVKQEAAEVQPTSSRYKTRTREKEPASSSSTRSRKPEKVRESYRITRISRSSRTPDDEKTKSTAKKSVADKSEVEILRRRRSQRSTSREEGASAQNHRRKVNAVKKPEHRKTSQST